MQKKNVLKYRSSGKEPEAVSITESDGNNKRERIPRWRWMRVRTVLVATSPLWRGKAVVSSIAGYDRSGRNDKNHVEDFAQLAGQ